MEHGVPCLSVDAALRVHMHVHCWNYRLMHSSQPSVALDLKTHFKNPINTVLLYFRSVKSYFYSCTSEKKTNTVSQPLILLIHKDISETVKDTII